LAAFHGAEGIYMDIKPENILVFCGKITLNDFSHANVSNAPSEGIASEHGTEMYMTPEQGEHGQCGRGANVFALDAVFTEMLLWDLMPVPSPSKSIENNKGHDWEAFKHYFYLHIFI
jgi:serine/threonine protein kinase